MSLKTLFIRPADEWVTNQYVWPKRLIDGRRSRFLDILACRRGPDGTYQYRYPTEDEKLDLIARSEW